MADRTEMNVAAREAGSTIDSRDRQSRIAALLERVAARRFAGEDLSDDAILSAYHDLLPELRDELAELRRVEQARRSADNGSSVAASDFDASSARSSAAAEFPGFEIRSEIHRGGQGVVYEAFHPATGRNVAIKVMRDSGHATNSERVRFEREVHILGQLRHPHIVAIHDSGLAGGKFFYVMDRIDGRPLDEWVAQLPVGGTRATAKARIETILKVFAEICDAVHAAHLHGVIHRDLKPGNILIDAQDEPHVLDFGLAKRVIGDSDASTDVPEMTMAGQFVGSLPWASPEQAEGRADQIDVRTDVYALGVMLYQALTGRFPYAVQGGMRAALDNIVSTAPIPPRALARSIDDELETIVLRCLEKQPARRYQYAGALAVDIRHYLAGEPIDAKRDSGWYVLTMLLRRNIVPTAVAAAFLVLLVGSSIGLWVSYGKAREQTRIAERQKIRAESAAENAHASQKFLEDMLASVQPQNAQGQEVTVRQLLDDAAGDIDAQFANKPEIAAALHARIGATYRHLGRLVEAEAHLRRALEVGLEPLGEEAEPMLNAMQQLAIVLKDQDKLDEAEQWYRRDIAAHRQALGPADADTLRSQGNFARFLQARARLAEAETVLRETIDSATRAFGEDDEVRLTAMNNLVLVLLDQNRYGEAEPVAREVVLRRRRVLGERDADALVSMNNLALCLMRLERFDEAELIARECLALRRYVLPEGHPNVMASLQVLAGILRGAGKLDEAETLAREMVAGRRRRGEAFVNQVGGLSLLAGVLVDAGKIEEAEALTAATLAEAERELGPERWQFGMCQANYGNCLLHAGCFDRAEPLLLAGYQQMSRILGPRAAGPQSAARMLVDLYERWGQPDRVEAWRALLSSPQ